ncbi:putative transcriptional regulatory protein [Vanrija pseudolonga]|uniref:Purtative transcriptional regulatory protein n=1 Tax=Vanrija pseudolonga TaxID=143232 RepID=A0AAF0Y8T8_9TREE|nr:purtative transcriptional regulatory protein [Vanrija pseudolonga]
MSAPSAPSGASVAANPSGSGSAVSTARVGVGIQPAPAGSNGAGAAGNAAAGAAAADKKRKAPPTAGGGQARPKEARTGSATEDESGAPSPTASVATAPAAPRPREAKRTRVHFSCVECHRRKQKCDRKEPCSQCVARRVPHLCRPFLNGVEDPNANSDVHARLATIEGMLTRLVSAIPQALSTRPLVEGSSPDVLSIATQGEDVFHPQSAPPTSTQPEPPRQVYPHKPPPSGLFPANLSTTTPVGRSGFGWGLREGRMISLSVEDNADLREVLATLRESGITKNHLEWLISGVPGRRMADGLVELYFRWTRYKMNRPQFERRYQIFFDSIGRNPTSPKIDADTLKWLPLMFIVLAIAALSAPTEIVPADEQQAWSRRFYGSAKSGLEYAKALQRDNLEVLYAGVLASRYMLLTRRPAEGSTPLTTAFQLGLYRDGTVLNLSDKREVEVRRRAWAMLYHLDRTISLLVGRPASISDAHTDARPPANLDDEEIESGDFDPAGHPMTQPTVYTYVIVRHRLAEIMGRIAYHTFTIQLPDYQTVLALDKELLAWRDSLPSFLAMQNADTSLDATHSYLFVQRHLLACEWYYTRITLNRPYLLRRKPQDGRYAYSRNAAIESATADLLSRRDFMMEKGDLVINSGGYRVLNSYMVLGVTIKLDPDSPQADELRHLLSVVSGRARDEQGRLSEPIVKEELAIVEFLTAKSTTKNNSSPANGTAANGQARGDTTDENTPVDLLLGLAKTNSGRRAAEEEKRQLRLQQLREREEQRQAQRRTAQGGPNAAKNVSASPWGYVAPQMPGIDVHQPFGPANNGNRQSRLPRPLQPPGTANRQEGTSDSASIGSTGHGWSPENPFSFTENRASPGFGGPGANNTLIPSPHAAFSGANAANNTNQQLANISPYQDMSLSLPTDQLAGLTQQNANDIFAAAAPPPEFGTAVDVNFDFSNLTIPQQGMDMHFNPFAIQQTGDEGSGSEPGHDDETTFLNFILTKFANSSAGEAM